MALFLSRIVSRIVVSAVFATFSLIAMSGAMAQQQTPDPLMPDAKKLRPWEQKIDRFYSRGNPQTEVDKATRKLYGDPMRRLGLPANRIESPDEGPSPANIAPTLQPGIAEMDRDRDGSISRQEYFQGRSGVLLPRDRVSSRGRRMNNRLNSQFRNADSNRDGIVTPEELEQSGGRRF